MAFRVVEKTFVVFESDLSPSLRSIHPSGVIHACHADPTATDTIMNDEHVFAWIPNSLKVDELLSHLEKNGFCRSHGIVFIPYSTKENWTRSYPHTPLSLECAEDGTVTLIETATPRREEPAAAEDIDLVDGSGGRNARKRKRECPADVSGDMSHLSVPERDELHVEIYNYLLWLHKRLAGIEEKTATAAARATETDTNGGDGEESGEANDGGGKKKRGRKPMTDKLGVDVTELRGALDKLESAFRVIPNMEFERFRIEGAEPGPVPGGEPDESRREAPFLEAVLKPALARLVEARARAGRPERRCRRRGRPIVGRGRNNHAGKFEEMLEKLEGYRAEHGNCLVPMRSTDLKGLGGWVSEVRAKRKKLLRRGVEVEEVGPGRPLTAMTLTAERIERLGAMGFVWEAMPSNVPWEENFRQLVEYHEEHGKWPAQHVGRLGGWVQRQRLQYHARDERYMKTKAPKLNEIGFEWTPKGYFRISWDEGFRKLMDFRRTKGHFDVPCPAYGERDVDGSIIIRKSDAHKFYKWVESLHQMYSSYKLGRRSGSLTEERVLLLMRNGFKFRDE